MNQSIKEQKEQQVAELSGKLKQASAVFLADYRGVNVSQVTKLRAELRKAGVEYRVVKNTMLRLAARQSDNASIEAYLEGPTAVAFAGADPVASAKVLADFAKTVDALKLKAGLLNGKLISADDIKALAEMPSREQLLAKLLGTLNAPTSNFVGLMAAIPRSLLNVLNAIKEQKAA